MGFDCSLYADTTAEASLPPHGKRAVTCARCGEHQLQCVSLLVNDAWNEEQLDWAVRLQSDIHSDVFPTVLRQAPDEIERDIAISCATHDFETRKSMDSSALRRHLEF